MEGGSKGIMVGFLGALLLVALAVIGLLMYNGNATSPPANTVPVISQYSAYQEAPAPQGDYNIQVPQAPQQAQGADLNATAQAGATQNAQLILQQMTQMAPTPAPATPVPTLQSYAKFNVCMDGIVLYSEPSWTSTPMGMLKNGETWNIVAMAGQGNDQWLAVAVDGVAHLWFPVQAYASCPQ